MAGEKVLDLKLRPPDTWASFTGGAASALSALKHRADAADVAGLSGYAFVVNVHPELCPSGPTAFDWEALVEGMTALGRDVQLICAPREPRSDARLSRELFDKVREQVDAGRPCLVWGAAGVPEFGIVYGYRDNCYVRRSMASCAAAGDKALGPNDYPEEPLRFDKLESPGSFSAFMFGSAHEADSDRAERAAMTRAVQLLRDRHPCYAPGYVHGIAAFEAWARAMDTPPEGLNPMGNAYNAQCYAELHEQGGVFLRRVAEHQERAAGLLSEAADTYEASARALGKVAGLFPFPEGKGVEDPARRREAAALLRSCRDSDSKTASALERALGLLK
jgi:hypothetical protein